MKKIYDERQNQLMRNKSFELSHHSDVDFKNIFLHSHDFYELYFFVGGKAVYSVDTLRYNLVPGDIMLISPNILHQLEVQNLNIPYERIVLWINPKYLSKLSTKDTELAKCFKICNENTSYLIRDFDLSEKIRTNLLNIKNTTNEFGQDIEKEIYIRKILLDLNRFLFDEKYDGPAVNARYAKRTSDIVSKAMLYIEENITNDLSLDVISENIFVSKFYLSRLFKEETNISIHKYILKKRLLLSKKMLESKISVKELYEACGFQDESSFFRAFKAEFGLTPKQYQNLINK